MLGTRPCRCGHRACTSVFIEPFGIGPIGAEEAERIVGGVNRWEALMRSSIDPAALQSVADELVERETPQWRCVGCKRVYKQVVRPERCSPEDNSCLCQTFAEIDR